MASDPRDRNTRHHSTGAETTLIDFAGPKLEAGFRYGPAPLVLSGAYNSAKTVTLCLKTLFIADLYPGYRWFVGRKVWDELRKTTMSSFFKFCPRRAWEPNGRRSDTEKILELNNGSTYIWGHLDDPDTLTLVRGLEINGFLLDQAEELYEEIFTALLPRLGRWDQVKVPEHLVLQYETDTGKKWPWTSPNGKLVPPSYALLTCNPDHELHWIYERFHPESQKHFEKTIFIEHDSPFCPGMRNPALKCPCGRLLADGTKARPGERISYHDIGYKMIELSAYDNKYATRQSLEEMESQDETWKRRFLHGKWGIPEGQIHEIRPESILDPTEAVLSHVHSRCTLHRAMDHGDAAPTAVGWFAVDGDGNVFWYREYYRPNALISEHRQHVAGLSRFERYRMEMADPHIFGPSMQKHNQRWSVAQEWADCVSMPRETAVFWQKGDNDEFGTRNRINEYLKPRGVWRNENGQLIESPRIHPITKELGIWPSLFFIKKTTDYPNGCDQMIRQTKSQRRMKLGTDNGKPVFSDDRDDKIADHAYDCAVESTRYVYWDGKWVIGTLGSGPKYGWVLTPYGPQRYSDLQCYKKNVPMVQVSFRNGTSVTTTPDHLFLTDAGWVEAENLLRHRYVFRFSMEEFTGKTPMGTFASSRNGKSLSDFCTVTSMNSITVESHADSLSIIAMKTDPTIPSRTYYSWIGPNTPPITIEDSISRKPYGPYAMDSSGGSQQMMAGNGASSIPPSTSMEDSTREQWNTDAFSVDGSVEVPRPPFVEQNGANSALMPYDISEIVNVVSVPPEDAWCLTVHHPCSSFLVEDGITVHNCLRYGMASQPPLPHGVPLKYSARSFEGMRQMAIAARRKGRIANMAKRARKQYEALHSK